VEQGRGTEAGGMPWPALTPGNGSSGDEGSASSVDSGSDNTHCLEGLRTPDLCPPASFCNLLHCMVKKLVLSD
jgi:hypothetical protein